MLVKALEREEILHRGIETGKEEITRQIVRAMAKKGFAPSLIAEITQLSQADVARFLAEAAAENPASTSAQSDIDA